MAYQCPVCKENVGDDLAVYIKHNEAHIFDVLKVKFPHWVTSDGLCRKCEQYFRQQMRGEQ